MTRDHRRSVKSIFGMGMIPKIEIFSLYSYTQIDVVYSLDQSSQYQYAQTRKDVGKLERYTYKLCVGSGTVNRKHIHVSPGCGIATQRFQEADPPYESLADFWWTVPLVPKLFGVLQTYCMRLASVIFYRVLLGSRISLRTCIGFASLTTLLYFFEYLVVVVFARESIQRFPLEIQFLFNCLSFVFPFIVYPFWWRRLILGNVKHKREYYSQICCNKVTLSPWKGSMNHGISLPRSPSLSLLPSSSPPPPPLLPPPPPCLPPSLPP